MLAHAVEEPLSDAPEKTGLLAFEARLRELADKVRAGFPERASELRSAAGALASDEPAARESIRRYAHKIHGTAGSHGFGALSERAALVEGLALTGERDELASEARALVDALEREAVAHPIVDEPPPVEPVSEVRLTEPTLAGLRIVAVDDDAATRKLLTLTLVNVGRAEAVVEERATSLLARLRSEPFDVVIVDAMMPETNGLACLQRIVDEGLHDEKRRYFVLSAASAPELAWALPAVLQVGWLRKPFRPRELVDAIALQLAR